MVCFNFSLEAAIVFLVLECGPDPPPRLGQLRGQLLCVGGRTLALR